MLKPRQYQITALNDLLNCRGNPVLLAPTGSGKTFIATLYMRELIKRKQRIFFLVHRDELLKQTIEHLMKFSLDFGVISSKFTANVYSKIQVCSVPTLCRRLDCVVRSPTVFIVDEVQHARANSWEKIFNCWPDAKRVGLTGTAGRTDGQPLGKYFTEIIKTQSVKELIESHFLANFKYVATEKAVDIKDRKTQKAMDAEAEKRVICGDVLQLYREHLNMKQCVLFAPTIKKSIETVDLFKRNGIPSLHLDGTTPMEDRIKGLKDFKEKKYLMLSNVRLFDEGWDSPEISGIIDMAPTSSIILKKQREGRALRVKSDGSKAIIVDMVFNYKYAGGFPDTDIEWSLHGKVKKPTGIRVMECPECGHTFFYGPKYCPSCGAEVIKQGEAVPPDVVDGSARVHKSFYDRMMAAHAKGYDYFCDWCWNQRIPGNSTNKYYELKEKQDEIHQCKTYSEFVALGVRRGFHPRWASVQFKRLIRNRK